MAISPQQLTIYLYSAHRAVIFAIAQLSCCYCERNARTLCMHSIGGDFWLKIHRPYAYLIPTIV